MKHNHTSATEIDRTQLSDTALIVLSQAAGRVDHMIFPLPDSTRLRGGAKDKLLRKLLRLRFVEDVPVVEPDQTWWVREDGCRIGLRIAEEGMRALGIEDQAAGAVGAEVSAEMSSSPTKTEAGIAARPGFRRGSKQAQLVDRLTNAGATLDELSELLGWQRHTVRAALTGLRRKGYRVEKTKSEKGDTHFRASLPPASAGESDEQVSHETAQTG